MITATYTLSQEAIAGTGNLSTDPLFFDPAGGDFHVRSTRGRFDPASGTFVVDAVDSPSIDAGDPSSDFSLEPGPNGLRVNLGHTGNTSQASMGAPGGIPPVAPVALTVATAGSGLGTVTSSPAGIDCGPSCTAAFASGTPVTLTATPAAGSIFAGWSGGGCSGTAPCVVAVTANVAVTATFAAALPALTLPINAPSFRAGQALILTATLTPGATPMLVDAYVVIRLPDGSFFSLLLDGRLVPGIMPIATGLTPIPLTRQLFSYTFNGSEPAGTYTWMSALTQAGTGNIIGSIQQVPFTFSP